jgi:predicted KAP-like P-loop ATPase
MWADNEADRDFLNFTGVAETVAEIIVQARGKPISIGVSGAWGVGKSSMIRMVRNGLAERTEGRAKKFVFVEFNAWLYQGYDDARAALLDVIATRLAEEAEERKTGVDKAQDLLRRVNWLRAAKLIAAPALALALGVPPLGLFGDALALGRKVFTGSAKSEDVAAIEETGERIAEEGSGLLNPPPDTSPPKEIQAIRDSFEATLEAMGVTLVVLIDDLDRCLPQTTISTLEAIRLFLFLKNTAFVIAADETMIKHAVRRHFEGVTDETLITSYFDKLIQVPIRVPPLGTQEVRAYLMLLFVENSTLSHDDKETIRKKVIAQLGQSWKGKRVDRAFMETVHANYPAELTSRFESADRLAPLMATASQIAGNPRLIKRFLNALSIRMTIASAHGVTVDEAALAKVLLFERSGAPAAYDQLVKAVNAGEGIPAFLAEWERKAAAGEELKLESPWDADFVKEWLTLSPPLGEMDLRGILYVSREHAPLITAEDRLSSDAAELLTAILGTPDMADRLKDRLAAVPRPEINIMMGRVLDRARRETEWGTPSILDAAIALSAADPSQGKRIGAFLSEVPPSAVKPGIVPKIGDQPWAADLFAAWESKPGISKTVKNAIKAQGEHGNI